LVSDEPLWEVTELGPVLPAVDRGVAADRGVENDRGVVL
jgi:hypothetical protein